MNLPLPRRQFLQQSSTLAVGLVLGFFLPGGSRMARAQNAATPTFEPNAFLKITPDNQISVMINRLELGQGVHTSLTMILADELDADWGQMQAELAPAGNAYKDPIFGMQMTGGSGSIKHSFTQYREVGARARMMLISAAAKQWNVTEEQCKTRDGKVLGPTGQIATYGELSVLAMSLPVPSKVNLKPAQDFKFIGKPMPRLDTVKKSTGQESYGIDFKRPGMKTVLVARPPVFGGKIARSDFVRARAVPGVIEVFEINTDRGGRGVAVVAQSFWQAKRGRDALTIQWDSRGLEKVSSHEQLKQYKELAKKTGLIARKDDMSALNKSSQKMIAEYSFPYLAHAPMEPLNCTVELKDTECHVWTGSQMQTIDQAAIARTTGLKTEQVSLNTLMSGGGFGRRASITSDYILEAVEVAKTFKQKGHTEALKVIWTREDDIKGGYYRPSMVHRAEIGLNAKGDILAWKHTVVGQSIAAGSPFEAFLVKDGIDSTLIEGLREPYDIAFEISAHPVKANVPVLWWRSVGSTHTAYVMETLIDEVASLAKIDPVTYRKKLLGDRHPRHVAALDIAVKKSGYGQKKLPYGHAFGVALHESFQSVVAYVVEASVENGKPRLHQVTAGVHCNRAINPLTIEAQVEGAIVMALSTTMPGSAITLKEGVVEQSNFDRYTVARMKDMPKVEVHIVESQDPPTGMGEPGLPPLAPALANAIAKLSGKRIRQLPFPTLV